VASYLASGGEKRSQFRGCKKKGAESRSPEKNNTWSIENKKINTRQKRHEKKKSGNGETRKSERKGIRATVKASLD